MFAVRHVHMFFSRGLCFNMLHVHLFIDKATGLHGYVDLSPNFRPIPSRNLLTSKLLC